MFLASAYPAGMLHLCPFFFSSFSASKFQVSLVFLAVRYSARLCEAPEKARVELKGH
jgi:hypothetical protein